MWTFPQSSWFCAVASGGYWRRAEIQSHHYTIQSHELGSAYLYINCCINQIQTQCLGKVPPFLANKSPCCGSITFDDPSTGLLKTLEIRASLIEDTKSRRAKTIACQLLALARSTLFIQCLTASCKVSVNAVCIPGDLSMTLITAAHMSDQPATHKPTW